MNPRLAAQLEKVLVLLLATSFVLPLALGAVFLIPSTRTRATMWLRNRTLSGVQIRPEKVVFSRDALRSARYQDSLARNYDFHFVGREMMIRSINEIYLRLLHVSPTGVLVGPHLSLIEPAYTREYCFLRPDPETLRPLVDDLRRMQDFCDARKIAFALVITPSKAAIYPENMPAGWLGRYRHKPRYYEVFLGLLQEKGVRCVDGHRIAAEMKPSATVPVFPLGGVHWGDPAALATTNRLLELLAGEGLGVAPIRNFETKISNAPEGQDRDMANLINTVFKWRYPVATVAVQPSEPENVYHPNMVLIGGSFTWKMLDLLDASRQFSELEFYSYYKNTKYCKVDGELHEVASPSPPMHFDTDVFAADSLVLEINEQTLHSTEHLSVFLRDALAVLPDPQSAKAAFHYESRMSYQWGDKLSFLANDHPVNIATARGLTAPGDVGSYTLGPAASLHFAAPAPAEDMVLEATASPFLINKHLPEQRVSVFVNGHPVGEWVWKKAAFEPRQLVIPKNDLGDGNVLLEFRIAHPASPYELGLSKDTRKFGICVSSIRLHAVGK